MSRADRVVASHHALRADGGSSARRRRRIARAAAGVLLAALAATGCRENPPSRPVGSAQAADGHPRAVVERVVELRAAHRHRDIAAHIQAPHGPQVVAFLLAVDEFLNANDRLCTWLRDNVGVGTSYAIDQSYVTDNLAAYAGPALGVFSRHVELLDETVAGDQAVVSYLIENELPARRVRLVREQDAWRLNPGPVALDRLTAAFRDMARALELVQANLEAQRLPLDELRSNPEPLVRLTEARLRRGVRMLSEAHATTAPAPGEP